MVEGVEEREESKMKRIPWMTISIICFIAMLLVAARSAVAVGKAFYYHIDWLNELVTDPWFYVGMAAAAGGIVSLIARSIQFRKSNRQEMPEESEEQEEQQQDQA